MNEVHVRGQIKTMPWRYDGNLYARISVRRDGDRPQRTRDNGGAFDYVTVMFPGGVAQGLEVRKDQVISVHGWLQSRDVHETLTDFLKRANAPTKGITLKDAADQGEITVHRTITEIVADRWRIEGG